MKEIKAKEGYYLVNKDKTEFYKAIKGMNVNEDDYIQVTEEEVKILTNKELDSSTEINELLL